MPALYDTIGQGYAEFRQPDPSIERAIQNALGDAMTIVNVGAGSGSYEPSDTTVVAVEPSMTMIRQRPADAAPAVQAHAMALPFAADTFDASLAILTVHHWSERERGLAELRRVSRGRVVIFTRDPSYTGFWLADYFPEITDVDRSRFPLLYEYEAVLGQVNVVVVPIPHDCTDGFLCAYWRRPKAYLDRRARSAISTFSKLEAVTLGVEQLARDIESGEWHRCHANILSRSELDLGYRLIVAA